MTATTPDSAAPKPPRTVCTVIAGACPLLLLGLYLFLSSTPGVRRLDALGYGTSFVAFGILIITVAALLLVGLVMSVWAVVRRERPEWLARAILVLNALLALAGLNAFN